MGISSSPSDPLLEMKKTPFVKELASSDRRARDKALESLMLFLGARRDLSLLELCKVWKGLFFCFYHSDRPLTQQALARSLSYSLVPTLPYETIHRFLRAFWITIGRDFHSLDRLRLDKYLFLVRCYIGVAFEVFLLRPFLRQKEENATDFQKDELVDWETDKKRKRVGDHSGDDNNTGRESKKKRKERGKEHNILSTAYSAELAKKARKEGEEEPQQWSDLEAYISILEEGPLCPVNFDPGDNSGNKDKNKNGNSQQLQQPRESENGESSIKMPHGPDGLRYHIMDIWLDELEKVIIVDDDDELDDPPREKDNNSDHRGDHEKDIPTSLRKQQRGASKTKIRREDLPIDLLLRPMQKLQAESLTRTVRHRAQDVLGDERLVRWGLVSPVHEESDHDEEQWDGLD